MGKKALFTHIKFFLDREAFDNLLGFFSFFVSNATVRVQYLLLNIGLSFM